MCRDFETVAGKALSTALRRGDATVSLSILECHTLSAAQCDKILSEVMEGEERLKDCAEKRSTLRARLGLVPLADAPGASERALSRHPRTIGTSCGPANVSRYGTL